MKMKIGRDILKMLKDPTNQLIIVGVILVAGLVAFAAKKTENFSKLPRYMYMFNPTSKNSSFDIRGEPKFIPKEMENVGGFYNSSYNFNYTNQRLPVE